MTVPVKTNVPVHTPPPFYSLLTLAAAEMLFPDHGTVIGAVLGGAYGFLSNRKEKPVMGTLGGVAAGVVLGFLGTQLGDGLIHNHPGVHQVVDPIKGGINWGVDKAHGLWNSGLSGIQHLRK